MTATAEATVQVPIPDRQSAAGAHVSAGQPQSGQAGMSMAWVIAAVLLLGLGGVAIFDVRRRQRESAARDEPGSLQRAV